MRLTWKSVGHPHLAPQLCPCGAGYRQVDFIHGHVGGGWAARPEHAHTGGGGLSMPRSTITTHNARAWTGPAGGGVWHSLTPGFGLKIKRFWGRCGSGVGDSGGVARRASVGWGRAPSLSDLGLKTHRTCYICADTERDGAGRATQVGWRGCHCLQARPCPRPRVGQTDGQILTQSPRGRLGV